MIRGAAALLAVVFAIAMAVASFIGAGFLLVLFTTLFYASILIGRRAARNETKEGL